MQQLAGRLDVAYKQCGNYTHLQENINAFQPPLVAYSRTSEILYENPKNLTYTLLLAIHTHTLVLKSYLSCQNKHHFQSGIVMGQF